MWPYRWTHVGTPPRLGHMDRVAATMPSQAHAGAAQEAPELGRWEGQDVPLVRPSSCNVKRGIPSSRRYLPTYLPCPRGKARRTGDTTTLHALTQGPAFEGKVSTHHLHSTSARPADPNTYTRYLVLLLKESSVLLTLL